MVRPAMAVIVEIRNCVHEASLPVCADELHGQIVFAAKANKMPRNNKLKPIKGRGFFRLQMQ